MPKFISGITELVSPAPEDAIGFARDFSAGTYHYITWATVQALATAPVDSVFGRVGVVVAAAGDYDASQVDNDSGVAGAFVSDALDTLNAGKAAAAHTHAAADVTDFAEAVDDRVAALVVAGSGITLTYDDGLGTLSIAASGGGGEATALDDLSDVSAGAPVSGNVLRHNGDEWVNAAIDAGDIDTGTLALDRGGLGIDASTIDVGGLLIGIGAGMVDVLDALLASDGDVLTLASGLPAWQTPTGGAGGDQAVRLTHSAVQAVADATYVVLAFDAELFDPHGLHDTATDNSRIAIVEDGKYLIIARVDFSQHATGVRRLEIIKNRLVDLRVLAYGSAAPIDPASTGVAASTTVEVVTLVDLLASDYVEVRVLQGSGSSLDLGNSESGLEFSIVRVA